MDNNQKKMNSSYDSDQNWLEDISEMTELDNEKKLKTPNYNVFNEFSYSTKKVKSEIIGYVKK